MAIFRRSYVRSAATVGAIALVASAVAVSIAPRSAAAATFESAPQLSFTYTDSRENDRSFTNTDPTFDIPVGSWLDGAGRKHKTRVFATYDISRYIGKHVVSTQLFLRDDK